MVYLMTMEDPKWLRLVTVGLILAALAVGYFLISGSFSKNKTAKTQQAQNAQVVTQSPSPSSNPNIVSIPSLATPSASTTPSAYNTIAERNLASIQTLPATGASLALILLSSVSAVAIGLGLRRYPN